MSTKLVDIYDKDTIDELLIDRLGLGETDSDKFNFAQLTYSETVNGVTVEYIEYWILINAHYDYEVERFVKDDITATSFGIQMQAKGSYPGEAELGYTNNTGINVWRCPIWKYNESDTNWAVWMDDSLYNYNDMKNHKYIGAMYNNSSWGSKNGTWRTFGVGTGWNNNLMTDSYGGVTIGGAGFEIDGNGIFPFTRLSSSMFKDENNNIFYLLGILDNAYHPDAYSNWKCDSNEYGAWFYGLKYPQTSGHKDSANAKFVIMYNDMSSIDSSSNGYTIEDMDVSDWETILEISTSSIKGMVNGTLTTLGAGGGQSITVDSSMSDSSTNPVQNKIVKSYIDGLIGDIEEDMLS